MKIDSKENVKVIKDVCEYLAVIRKINEEIINSGNDTILVYRGEPRNDYKEPGQPGIFRANYLKRDKHFEKNILLELKANRLTSGGNYLEMAIDSQHGGFPSRLLDVSYNCLVALYFACVSMPERKDEEKKYNGRVLIYEVDKTYCPTAENAILSYENLVDNPASFLNSPAFECNHKLVDHIKLNQRIIAQQGALILFQGNQFKPIPDWMTRIIEIDKTCKDAIERELDKYFGINTSFIYPEIEHAVNRIKEAAKKIDANELSIENEVNLTIANYRKRIACELEYISDKSNGEIEATIIDIEKCLKNLRDDLSDTICDIKDSENVLKNAKIQYNDLLDEYRNLFYTWFHLFITLKR